MLPGHSEQHEEGAGDTHSERWIKSTAKSEWVGICASCCRRGRLGLLPSGSKVASPKYL